MQNRSGYQLDRRIRLRKEGIDSLGGKCIVCGYNKCDSALDFHHVLPSNKEATVAILINKGHSEARINKEIKKCILLCCRCHREFHAGMISI